jgi:phasin family protein
MSQKPKAGAQVRPPLPTPAPATKATSKDVPATSKDVLAKTESVKAAPDGLAPQADVPAIKMAPEAEAAAKPAPMPVPAVMIEAASKVTPAARPEPTPVKAEPIPKADPVITPEPVAKVEPAPEVPVPVTVSPPVEPLVAAPAPPAAVAEPVKEVATAIVDTIAAVTAASVEQVAAIKPTEPTLTQGLNKMMKSTEELVAFNQANMEAFIRSGQIWSAGMQELTKQMANTAKATFEESMSTFKAISTAKSVKEAMDLQSSFAKAAVEKAMAESNKLTDASIKLTEQTLAPITARVTDAVESFKTH